jgi:anti-sigma factor RsiW
VSHLGDLLSALVDGELSGTDLDRANAHVAACGACRVEANALRRLKHDLRALAEVNDSGEVTKRLLAMTGQAGPVSARQLEDERGQRRRAGTLSPRSALPSGRLINRRGGRYLLWSTLSLVVVGIGTAAFGMGGSSGPTGPQITPQLEVFDAQHAITSGDVPFDDPADVSARVPVVAATP